jgi:hypothetical protein
LALFGHAGAIRRCPLIAVNRKWLTQAENGANDPTLTYLSLR